MLSQISEIIPFLEKSLNATVSDYTAAPLTAQGDNFGSTIMAISVKIKLNNLNATLDEVRLIYYNLKKKLFIKERLFNCTFI